jgi:tetratricopeptide (TPR) repeat protein
MRTCQTEKKIYSSIFRIRFGAYCFMLLLSLALSLPASCLATPDQDMQEAVNLLEQKDFSRAVDLLLEIQTSITNPDAVVSMLAFAYLGLGHQQLAAGDFSAAREAFREGRRYDEDDVRFWQGEAISSYRQGRYAEAASLVDQALGIAPQNADLYHLLGITYYADGRMAEALDALTRANELDGGAEALALLEKVSREWQLEENMGQEVRGHFQISFVDGDQVSGLAGAILEILEDAYVALGSELAFYPDVKVVVLLYTHKDFAAVTNSPDWAGAAYDGKIRLPLGGLSRMNDRLAGVLYHEYAHVLVRFLTNRNAPVWLNEGLAEMAGRRIFSPALQQLQQAKANNQLLGWDGLVKPFSGLPADKVLLAYEQSYSLVQYMVDTFGWYKISELLQRLGKRQEWQAAVADTYAEFGLDWPAILKEWQAGLN